MWTLDVKKNQQIFTFPTSNHILQPNKNKHKSALPPQKNNQEHKTNKQHWMCQIYITYHPNFSYHLTFHNKGNHG